MSRGSLRSVPALAKFDLPVPVRASGREATNGN